MPATIQKILKPSKYRALDSSTSEQETYDVQTDGEFNGADDTNWQTGTASSISGGYAIVSDSGGNSGNIVQGFNAALTKGAGARGIKQGDRYRVQMVVEDPDSGAFDGRVRVVLYSESPGGVGGDNYKAQSSYLTSAGTLDQIVTIQQTNTGNYHDAIVIENTNDPCNFKIASIKVTKLEVFGSNNHAQIYSGRALEFDGIGDYLDTGTPFSETSHTIACWVYMNSITADKHIFDARDSGSDGIRIMASNPSKLEYQLNADSDNITSTVGYNSTWVRAVFTYDGATQKIYINGILDTSLTVSETIATTTNAFIGARNFTSATNYFDGKLSDFQAWNTAWTQSDVTYDYLNPESLALSNGGTSLTESNLKLWYPMQDGHKGQQSYIMDGANTGLGPELISDISASAWTKGFATDGGSVDASTTITDNADGSVTFETAEASDWQTVSVPFVNENGVTYKISITGEALAETDGDNDDKFYWRVGSTANNGHNTDNINSSFMISEGAHTETNYFSSNVSTGTAYFVGMFKKASNTVHKFRLDSVSIKAVNQKHHATTVFLGEELAAEGDFENAGAAWSTLGSTITVSKTSGAFVSTGDADGGFGTCSQSETLTAGRTYRLQFDVTAVTGSPTVHNYCGALNKSLLTASVATFTDTFVASSADASEGGIDVRTICANGESVTIDNISFKEVGVASGWTDASQQLDIPQTALQSYNQLAWFDGTGDYVDINPSGAIWNTTDGTFNSISLCVHHASESDDTNSQVMYFGTEHGSPNFYILQKDSDEYHVGYNTGNGEVFGVDLTKDFIHDKWHHWVMNVKMNSNSNDTAISSSDVELFLNGQKLSLSYVQGSNSNGMDIPADGDINLFGSATGTSYNPTGSITEVVVFNDQLTTAEVQELYNDGKILDAREHSLFATKCSGYWKNNGLAQWTDYSGNDNHGTVKNVTETILLPAGVDTSRDTQGFLMNRQKTTNSLNLHGILSSTSDTGAYGDVGDQPSLDFGTNNFSVSFWFKLKSDDIKMTFVGKQDSSSGWYLYYDADADKISFYHRKDNKYTHGTTNPSVDRWYHCCFTRNGATGKIYLDSVDDTASTQDISADLDSSGDLFEIGRRNLFTADDRYLDGQIDDVLIYNDVLSADEVERVYNAGKRSHK